ncbi:MAG: alpha-glucosidase/alpha-galactosidase [Anaeroplasmataceae bacterium]|nr:alpha-glucosidase/alpha-galactosidase [Anaeroplasmataceae bacterium]
MQKTIKIAYIGGGSKLWARVFMSDLALAENLSGEIALYDIDKEAAIRNAKIGGYINKNPKTKSKFDYKVYDKLEDALADATFVVLSILPGTFKEMRSDVHAPEKYGIYQSVGDTAGPGGVLRAMRTVPIYEDFAKKIKAICPNAWVINFTNPMSICTKVLYDVFPEIKAFGCCHEVFHAQEFLTCILKEIKGINVHRSQIYTDACGVNHFTWMTEAKYGDIDLLALLPEFEEKFYEEGYFEREGKSRFEFKTDPFAYGNKLKMDLYNKYGVLAAAGDRHLAEFMPNTWYLKDKKTVEDWQFGLTTVDFREKHQAERIAETIDMAEGRKEFPVVKSTEEAVDLMKAILGFGSIVSNVNMPNQGQMPQMPLGSIVETNCVFSNDQVKPIVSKPLPSAVANLVYRSCVNIDTTYEGIKERDLGKLYIAFANQALCNTLTMEESYELFKEMCYNTRNYLDDYFDLDGYFKK